MKNYMFEIFMYGVRHPIRSAVFILKDKMPIKEAIERSKELTKIEIDIVYRFEKNELN